MLEKVDDFPLYVMHYQGTYLFDLFAEDGIEWGPYRKIYEAVTPDIDMAEELKTYGESIRQRLDIPVAEYDENESKFFKQALMRGPMSEKDMLTDLRIKCCILVSENLGSKFLRLATFPFTPHVWRKELVQSELLA